MVFPWTLDTQKKFIEWGSSGWPVIKFGPSSIMQAGQEKGKAVTLHPFLLGCPYWLMSQTKSVQSPYFWHSHDIYMYIRYSEEVYRVGEFRMRYNQIWFQFYNAGWTWKKEKLLRCIPFFCVALIELCYNQNQYKYPISGIFIIITW